MSYIYGARILDVSRSYTMTQHTMTWPRISAGERPQAAHLLRSWVRIPPGAWIFVCCECRVLSGRGFCYELITRPEESYRLCCVVVCDLETSRMGAPYIYDISHLRVKFVWLRKIFSDFQERFCSMYLAIYLLNNLRQEVETVVVHFVVLSKHVPRENEENHDILFFVRD